jgi:hypothetical protein
MDMNMIGLLTGSVFAAAAIVPIVVSMLRDSIKGKR